MTRNGDMAIVGMACRFPGAVDYNQFWRNLDDGVNSIREIPPERWDNDRYYAEDQAQPNTTLSRWCGLIEGPDRFDARFFNIFPREANVMDPQQRLLLEESWHCLEDAGVVPEVLQRAGTAVIVGSMANDYIQHSAETDVHLENYSGLGNYTNVLSNRLSHFYGLDGPSNTVNGACASSFVALHEARLMLMSGDCRYALVGAVNLNLHPWKYITFSKARMLSPTGRCHTFDETADGYVPGDGVAVILIRPLADALRDRDHIHGVIRGSAINHNGGGESLSAPSVAAQRKLILTAYRDAGFGPDTVTYVEAHGTGTSLGDPIEVAALSEAFESQSARPQSCHLGSVKTNIGHLEGAAGLAGLIKVLLMMRHRRIPPSLNVDRLNPIIDFERTPFLVPLEGVPWTPAPGTPLRAGISSFGFGGTNTHILVEEPPTPPLPPGALPSGHAAAGPASGFPFLLSARSQASLNRLHANWQAFLAETGHAMGATPDGLRDLTATLAFGRRHHPLRFGCWVASWQDLEGLPPIPANGTGVSDRREEGQFWGLVLSGFDWTGWDAIPFALRQERFFASRLDLARQTLAAVDARLAEDLTAPVWSPAVQPVLSLAVAWSAATSVLESGFDPVRLICCDRQSRWLGLVLSGVVGLDVAVRWLSGRTVETPLLRRPRCALFDPITGRFLPPVQVTVDYLRKLLGYRPEWTAETLGVVEESQRLFRHQHTFRRFLEDWDGVLAKHLGTRMDEVLSDPATGGAQEPRRLLLWMVILVGAQRKLRRKWHLARRTWFADDRFDELVDLTVDGVLDKDDLVEALFGDDPGALETLAATMTLRRDRLDGSHPYPLLTRFNECLEEITDLALWLEGGADIAPAAEIGAAGRDWLALGRPAPELGAVTVRSAFSTGTGPLLLDLWTAGVDIDWSPWFPVGGFAKRPLPVYPFESKPFWVKPVKQRVETAGGAGVAAAPAPPPRPSGASGSGTPAEPTPVPTASINIRLKAWLATQLAEVLDSDPDEIDDDQTLRDLGLDSLSLTSYADRIIAAFNVYLDPALLFQMPTLEEIAAYLFEQSPDAVIARFGIDAVDGAPTPEPANRDMAIIGVSGRFPGAATVDQFWRNLVDRRDLITETPADRWNWRAVQRQMQQEGSPKAGTGADFAARWGGFLDDVDRFDADFFCISADEARLMDPQQRLLVEEVWRTLEAAAIPPSSLRGSRTGIFVGVCNDDYKEVIQASGLKQDGLMPTGEYFSILANRISYLFDFHGPSVALDAACASSLVALQHAVRAVRDGDCDLALAAGVNLCLTSRRYSAFIDAGMVSPQGRCKTFDRDANGYVRSEAVGVVLIKPLHRAEADGDPIHGVVKGVSVNHGGRANALTAPNPDAQVNLLLDLYRSTDLPPDTIGFIETHGTGTLLGDSIEINALKKAFAQLYQERNQTVAGRHCGLGAVKTNIGHSESAAGVAGLIKVLLAMKHGWLPGNLNVKTLNPYIHLDGSPFELVDKGRPWHAVMAPDGSEPPRRAGISAFGFGGVNAHAVVEAYRAPAPPRAAAGHDGAVYLIVLSARTLERLRVCCGLLADFLIEHADDPELSLEALAWTLQTGRDALKDRLALVGSSVQEIAAWLHRIAAGGGITAAGIYHGVIEKKRRKSEARTGDLARQIDRYLQTRDLDKLARAWVEGGTVDWSRLHRGPVPKRLTLPGYPFAGERHWVTPVEAPVPAKIGPMVPETVTPVRAAPGSAAAPVSARQLDAGELAAFYGDDDGTGLVRNRVLPLVRRPEGSRAAPT